MNTNFITATAACLALTLATHAMPTDQKEWREAEETVKHVREVYGRIQDSEPTSTQKIPFNLEGDPMEGTITKREYDGGLTAITLDYVAGDHGGSKEHFYYEDKKLVFAFVQDSSWQFASGGTAEQPKTEDTLTELRFYFRDEKCVRALEKSVTSSDADKLPALIKKQDNREVAPDTDRVKRLLKTAKGLLIVNRGAMAQDFIESVFMGE